MATIKYRQNEDWVDVIYSDIGAAAENHEHAAADITSGTLATARIPNLNASKITAGTLSVARGGTGATTGAGIGLFAYPVGSLFFATVNSDGTSKSPADLFGGTWLLRFFTIHLLTDDNFVINVKDGLAQNGQPIQVHYKNGTVGQTYKFFVRTGESTNVQHSDYDSYRKVDIFERIL